MPSPSAAEILREMEASAGEPDTSEDRRQQVDAVARLARSDPLKVAAELLRTRQQLSQAQRKCNAAAEAALKLESMLAELLEGNRLLCRLVALRVTPDGAHAVCMAGGSLRELPIHPDVEVEQLQGLESWEYVTVREQVVVGIWRDDSYLFLSAHGDVVTFKGYKDREQHLAIVAHGPEERTVMLARTLWDEPLGPHSRLVLQKDDPHRAISVVPIEHRQCRFEVPIDRIHTRLEDLAGVEEIAETLLEDILLRIFHPDIRDQYGLDSLKGILLYSKPGMGKTAFVRAIALWLHEHSEQLDFEVVLYVVKPNETKSMWHGEDARIVREELWDAIRARQRLPRSQSLVQVVVMDEIDSLGKRPAAGEHVFSSAQSDALEAMLAEMDGMIQDPQTEGPPAHVLCAGMTNRPDRVDEAAKRPGRFDLVLPMPEVDCESAEDVMEIYARRDTLPWYLHGEVNTAVDELTKRADFLRPAVKQVFPAVVLRYKTDTQQSIDVTAGEILANVHYKDAVNRAKKRAALRQLRRVGIPAVTLDDVVDCLVDVSIDFARQMEADPQMLIRQLSVKVPVSGVEAVPVEELQQHHFLRVHSA